jgi:hypothetical protein
MDNVSTSIASTGAIFPIRIIVIFLFVGFECLSLVSVVFFFFLSMHVSIVCEQIELSLEQELAKKRPRQFYVSIPSSSWSSDMLNNKYYCKKPINVWTRTAVIIISELLLDPQASLTMSLSPSLFTTSPYNSREVCSSHLTSIRANDGVLVPLLCRGELE